MRTHLVLLCAAAALLVGCGDSESTSKDSNAGAPNVLGTKPTEGPTSSTGQALTIVHGTFAETTLGLDNARVIAIADDQTSYWAYLDAHGEFSLELPVGVSYRIVFANQLDGGGQVKIGSVAFKTSSGYSAWFGANVAGSIDLGMVTTNESGAGGSTSSHSDNSGCQKDDGSAKKDPSTGAGVNVCLIWPTVVLFPGVAIDEKFADKSTHPVSNHDDDQTCGFWNVEGGGIIWAAPSIGLGAGFGPIQAGADIGISANGGANGGFGWGGGFGMSSSWSYSSSMDYSYSANGAFGSNANYHFSTSSSWSYSASGGYNAGGNVNAGGGFAWSSAVNYSWHSSMGYAGTVAIAGGVTLGVAYGVESDYQVGGVIAAAHVAGGWAVGFSSEYHAEVAGGVCVSATSCDSGLSCTAGTCIKQ